MAPISPGKMSGSPRKPKKPTATTKAHRFEGFTKRVAKIKIDPVHTVQKTRVADDNNDLSQSFFRSALDEWAELNLSATFTSFLQKAQPLSESLPQLLHHADEIFGLLHEHIEKQDVLALEPLLSLVAHLAHDLGTTFEKHFASTVRLVARVSTAVDDPAAIEWCFTCLAWIFKYLSRLLVQDLCPLLEIMVPHFSSKKEYIRKFSAESLAFLLRKAAVMYLKKSTPLRNAVSYLFDLLKEKDGLELEAFEKALMTLLTETAIGVDAQLHSSATDLFKCLFTLIGDEDAGFEHALSVLDGTIISLIHRTDATGFQPLLELITDIAKECRRNGTCHDQMSIGLLLDIIATRKGSRISNWKSVSQAVILHLQSYQHTSRSDAVFTPTLLTISAILLQYCPMDQLLPFVKDVIDNVIALSTTPQFFAFCEAAAELGKQRFLDLVLPRLQHHIVLHWNDDEDTTCHMLHQLGRRNVISANAGASGYTVCPKEWESSIVNRMRNLSRSAGVPEDYAKFLRLHEVIHFPKDKLMCTTMQGTLESFMRYGLDQQTIVLDMPVRLSIGWGFNFYLSLSRDALSQHWNDLCAILLECRKEVYQLAPFLEAMLEVLNRVDLYPADQDMYKSTELAFCNNMLSNSIVLRQKSLEILLVLGRARKNDWLCETCGLLLELLDIPYLPSNARQIAMLIRRLPKQQEHSDDSSTLRKLIPLFGLGLLRHYHDQTRKDLCIALGQIATKGKAEDVILDVTIQWLHKPSALESPKNSDPEEEKLSRLSPFQCSNYIAIQKISRDTFQMYSNVKENLKLEIEQAHHLRPATTPDESRVLALQILSEIPEVAERRSRSLSPLFLSVQQGMANQHVPHSDSSASSHTISPDFNDQPWSLRERKLFLELLGKFVNPRVLYRSNELYDHLLELLTNGNSDVPRLALLAMLNWKGPSLPQYQEILTRVAEEKNAITELALLFANDEETGSIKSQDRQNVLPILLRLVFGQLIGRTGTHGSQEAKRKSILRLLFRMEEREVNLFLGVALGRLGEVSFTDQASSPGKLLSRDIVSQDQQYGFLRMMLSLQEILQSQYGPYGTKVVDAVLYCTARACHQTNHTMSIETASASAPALVKNIKRSGLQSLTVIFEYCEDINWDQYIPVIFGEIVDPRVPNLLIELAQGVSGLLRMFSAWSKSHKLVHLLKFNSQLTESLWKLLSVPSARDDVKTYVLDDILMSLLNLASDTHLDLNVALNVLRSDVESLLQSIVGLLQKHPPKELLLATTKVIPLLAPFAISSSSASEVLNLLIALLCEPAQRIPPHIKGQLLLATESMLKSQKDNIELATQTKLYEVVAGLYNYFKDQPNRVVLGELLATLVRGKSLLETSATICQHLNAVSTKDLGDIDYERQLGAYNEINSLAISDGTSEQWSPILNNLIFFARTADDFAIRSNAVNSLKHFITTTCGCENLELQMLIRSLLLPSFRKGVRENSELVRADFVSMFGLVVKHLPSAPDLEDMKVLLVGDDEEASFFTNILHIQQHRRLRAIRRLLTEVERGVLKSSNITDFFLPLLEKFIDDEGEDESAQGVKGQSIAATSTLLQWIDWKHFRATFRQYKTDLETAARPEKDAIKLLNNAADALTAVLATNADNALTTGPQHPLKNTLPAFETIFNELKNNFIPKLSKFIHYKDEAEISLRIPAAKVAVKLIKILPADEISLQVAPIVLDISQILRSRAQESRDIARNTLAEIVLLLGPSSVQFVLKQMRTALTRGYQLHVLSYTLHTILLQTTESRDSGDLDYCLEDLVSVIVDDIFGIVGQEKENQDYVSDMKEVKSSKSQDSMEILAKSTSVRNMSKLIAPFQTLLSGNLNSKQVRKVDDLFRRIGVGISHNPSAASRDLLVFAYELVQEFYKQKIAKEERVLTNDETNRQRFLIQLKSAGETTSSTSSSLQFKVAKFALDIVRSTLAKHSTLLTPENVHGFLPIIGDAMIEAQEDVRMSALRLLSTIIRLPMPELDTNASLYVMEAVKVVKGLGSTNEESAQAALKLVASILRERRDVQVRDSDIAYLLHRTMPDIEEPDRQGVTFNFIKAVMARRYELPEVYEIMDKIGIMMITNQSRSARDVARGVFVHFLLDYPQSKTRWTKQLRFLVKNLEYEYREGRQSVMEALHVLLQKLKDEVLQEVVSTFFIPIVLRMTNDDDLGCREMAGALLARIFEVADSSELPSLLEPLRSWLEQTENISLTKLGMQAWRVYFDAKPQGAEVEIAAVRKAIARALQEGDAEETEWDLQYQTLELFSKLSEIHPADIISQKQISIWTSISKLLTSDHTWIQISAARLVNTLLADSSESLQSAKLPLKSNHNLRFDEKAVLKLIQDSVRVVKRNIGNVDLTHITLQNLIILGKYAEATKLSCEVKTRSSLNDTDEEQHDELKEESDLDDGEDSSQRPTTSIPAIQYLLDQMTLILRREPSKLSTSAFTPRTAALGLLNTLIPQLSNDSVSNPTLTALLIPVTHITDPSLQTPRSADLTFGATYQSYTESAHSLQEIIHRKVGDATYIKLMTDVSKIVRERRGERRKKRAIERVAEPERAEREKQRKKNIKARRKKSLIDIHRKKRRGNLGF